VTVKCLLVYYASYFLLVVSVCNSILNSTVSYIEIVYLSSFKKGVWYSRWTLCSGSCCCCYCVVVVQNFVTSIRSFLLIAVISNVLAPQFYSTSSRFICTPLVARARESVSSEVCRLSADILCGRLCLTLWAENWHTRYTCPGEHSHKFWFYFLRLFVVVWNLIQLWRLVFVIMSCKFMQSVLEIINLFFWLAYRIHE